MTIFVNSLDYDGCVAYAYKETQGGVEKIIADNRALLNKMLAEKNQSPANKVICMVGSGRQSYHIDKYNRTANGNGSCFRAIVALAAHAGAEVDGLLLADVYGSLKPGTSFLKAIAPDAETVEHSAGFCDFVKTYLLYVQMHKVAADYPDQPIIFSFYDDRENDILSRLNYFFSTEKARMPQGVTLRLINYCNGELKESFPEIKGEGVIDRNYSATLERKNFQELVELRLSEKTEADVASLNEDAQKKRDLLFMNRSVMFPPVPPSSPSVSPRKDENSSINLII